MKPEVIRIIENADLELAWAIRREVFVIEQKCPEDIEWEFEEESIHYLVKVEGKYVGTARWRTTENGIKLERFAVLAEARNKGAASALLQTILAEISDMKQTKYLHAQLQAAPLYAKFGFKPKGEHFWEADIEHVKMVWQG